MTSCFSARLTDHNCESGVLGSRSRRDGQHFRTFFVAELALLRAGRPADTFEEMDPSRTRQPDYGSRALCGA